MRQYFTYRNIPAFESRGAHAPDPFVQNSIPGLPVTVTLDMVKDSLIDGRILGLVETPTTADPAADADKIAVVADLLQIFSYHPKTFEKAKDFVVYIFGRTFDSEDASQWIWDVGLDPDGQPVQFSVYKA